MTTLPTSGNQKNAQPKMIPQKPPTLPAYFFESEGTGPSPPERRSPPAPEEQTTERPHRVRDVRRERKSDCWSADGWLSEEVVSRHSIEGPRSNKRQLN
jgi:hypothetical protein